MTTFGDDFNRANGPLGNGWTTTGYGCAISSQQVITISRAIAYRPAFTTETFHRSRLLCAMVGSGSHFPSPMVKHDPGNGNLYLAYLSKSTTVWSMQIRRYAGAVGTIIGSTTFGTNDTNPHTVEITYNAGVLTALFDGTPVLTANDNTYAANQSLGFVVTDANSRADDFYGDDIANPASLDVQPDTYTVMGGDPPVTFTGVGTNWDPNTNTPVFTVDEGSIENQVIDSATTAHADYVTPVVTRTVTFTDPSTNETDTLDLTANFSVSGGGDNSDVLAVLGTPILEETVLDDLRSLMVGVALTALPKKIGDLLSDLYDAVDQNDFVAAILTYLGINQGTETQFQSVSSVVAAILGVSSWTNRIVNQMDTNITAIRGEQLLTLDDVVDLVAGVPNLTILQLKAVLDAMTVDGTYTLLDLYTEIQAVRGVPFMDLRTLYDAVLNIPPMDVALITQYLDWITGTQTVSLVDVHSDVNTAITNVNGLHDDQAAAFSNLTGAGANTLQTILNALATHDAGVDSDHSALNLLLNNLHADVLADYNQIMSTLVNIHSDIETDYALDGQIWAKVSTLQNANLAPIITQLNRIETKIDALTTAQVGRHAPVWPGLANVTLAAPTTVTASTVISANCHGCVVTVNATEPNTSKWTVDTHSSHKYSGYVAFISDRGDVECHQYIGQDTAIYTPTTMVSASAILIYLMHATSVTVRPWTLNV